MENNLSVEMMVELAKHHQRRADVLSARAKRVLVQSARAALDLQARGEQQWADYYTLRVRALTPRPIQLKVTA